MMDAKLRGLPEKSNQYSAHRPIYIQYQMTNLIYIIHVPILVIICNNRTTFKDVLPFQCILPAGG